MTNNKEGPFRHIPGGESLPACWPECPACAYAAGVKAERGRCATIADTRTDGDWQGRAIAEAIRSGQEPGGER